MKKNIQKLFAGVMGLSMALSLPFSVPSVFAAEISESAETAAENKTAETTDAEIEEMLSGGDYEQDHILVMMDKVASADEIQTLSAEDEADIISDYTDSTLVSVEIPEGMTIEETLKSYAEMDGVQSVFPDYELELLDTAVPGLDDPGVSSQNYLADVDAVDAWNFLSQYKHEKVRVCVLDSGCNMDHPDLTNVINKDLSKELIESSDGTTITLAPLTGDDVTHYSTGKTGDDGHGTHVCGIIAAEANNAVGISGVAGAYDNSVVDLVAVDIFRTNSTPMSFLIAGLDYAKSIGSRVVNISLGVKASDISKTSLNAVEAKCDELRDAGIILVCAAGNNGTDDKGELDMIPSDFDSCISVAWVNADGTRGSRAGYSSNYGSKKDIASPGTAVYSTAKDGTYTTKSGTSMAAPMVTAAVAMMISLNPDLGCDNLISLMQDSCSACKSSEMSELGIVQAGTAVQAALEVKELPFIDVHDGDWYYEYVRDIYLRGIMTGLTTTVFGPAQKVSRAQFATVLYRMNGSAETTYAGTFPDVSDGTWYTAPAEWAASVKVITGYQNGKFGPADNISREQIATMLYRYANYIGLDTSVRGDLSRFEDAGNVSAFAKEAVEWAVGCGIITGKSETELSPQGEAVRAECATMLQRFINVSKK